MVDFLFTLALFCVFAASSLMVVMIGANVYQETAESMEQNNTLRTSLTYVAEKLRQSDAAQGVTLSQLEGQPALVLRQTFNETVYETWIYHYDGALCELFIPQGNEIHLAEGRKVVDVNNFTVTESNDCFTLTAMDKNGQERATTVSLRSNP